MKKQAIFGASAVVCALLAAPLAGDDAASSDPLRVAETRADALLAQTSVPASAGDGDALLARARAAFAAAGAQACVGAAPRIVAMRPAADGTVDAYLLSASDTAGQVFPGNHFRLTFAADGAAGEPVRFGGACDPISWDSADEELDMRVGYIQRPGALMPSEIDLWLSHQVPFALGIVTPPTVWPVIGGRADQPVEADPEMIAALD